jgi:GH24 family phage-related lysozyme (muramidase)
MLINLAKNFIRNGILIGILFMRQEPNMKAAEGAGLTMDNLDFEFMTKGDPVVEVKDTAGRFQQNLTPEEINEMAELAPYAEKFMLLTIKGETGRIPSEEDVNQLLQQTTQEMASTNEQGMPSEQGSGAMVPQDMQSEAMVPSRPVEEQMPQNAAVPADNAAPIDRMAIGGGVAAGPIGVVDKPGADNSGVADDVPAESDGFVINAAAVRHAGLRDINDMIQNAKEYAKKQGMKLDFGKTPTDAEQILVSNGEVVIPDVIANIIGYDRLEKINNRGKKETEEKIQEQEQQPQQPAPTRQPAQPVMQAAEGGQVEELFPGEIPVDTSKVADGKVEKELPETPYIYKNPETAEFLKRAEGTIAFQTKKGSYDPKTKEFLTYPDSEGIDTIGYGTTENVRKDMRVSERVADMALDQRIDKEVSTLIADKIPRKFLDNPKTRTALVSLQYNLGRSGWKKAKESLKKGDIGNFLFYAYEPSKEAGNTYLIKSKGHAKRRNDEKKLFEEGLDELGLN